MTCPHCASARAEITRTRKLLRATLGILTEVAQLSSRATVMIDAVYDELGVRRTVHERETVPEMAAVDGDDDVSAGETVFIDPEDGR